MNPGTALSQGLQQRSIPEWQQHQTDQPEWYGYQRAEAGPDSPGLYRHWSPENPLPRSMAMARPTMPAPSTTICLLIRTKVGRKIIRGRYSAYNGNAPVALISPIDHPAQISHTTGSLKLKGPSPAPPKLAMICFVVVLPGGGFTPSAPAGELIQRVQLTVHHKYVNR